MTEPHERPEFHNSVEYTVTLRLRVAGGTRRGTAERRAERAAEKLANHAARLGDVVEVTATASPSVDGKALWPQQVHFTAANTGTGAPRDPDKLDRYLDADHERALVSLAAANKRQRERQDADRARRLAVSCPNTHRRLDRPEPCRCVYCRPRDHLIAAESHQRFPESTYVDRYCLCGQWVATFGERCLHHRTAELVVLDGDDPALCQLADFLAREPERQRDRDTPEPDLEP